MYKVTLVAIFLGIESVLAQSHSHPGYSLEAPCKDNDNIYAKFLLIGLARGERNQYDLVINEQFERFYLVVLKLDSEDGTVTLIDDTPGTVIANPSDRQYNVIFTEPAKQLRLRIQGVPFGNVPYPTSIKINSVEHCQNPATGYIDKYITGEDPLPDESCGRRKVQHTELIVNAILSKPGDWPWHAAIYRMGGKKPEYICGGTLLNEKTVLTAAHCVTYGDLAVPPEQRKVVLGKYNLTGEDMSSQESEVNRIIVHGDFKRYPRLDNDIAIVKLKTDMKFSDYIQPACIWYTDSDKHRPEENIRGTVVGWGYDKSDSLTSTLLQVTIPIVSETICIKSNPLFFSRMLNNQKFCAGYDNGTSVCNGDSGGGYLVFVPDKSAASSAAGSWFIRGIVSLSVRRSDAAICDPYQYAIFTDVAEYRGWLNTHLHT